MAVENIQRRSHELLLERRNTYRLLMMAAGMMGAYTFVLRGNAFCNAQTANVVLMAIALGQGKWSEGLYYLVPITAYFLGAFFSEMCLTHEGRVGIFRWETWLIAIEILILFGIGWIPLTVPYQVVQVIINFLASMQYNTFRRVDGIAMATTFCTNHIRQVGISAAELVRGSEPDAGTHLSVHLVMLAFFVAGGILCSMACAPLRERAIWVALAPLALILVMLVHRDFHDYLSNR